MLDDLKQRISEKYETCQCDLPPDLLDELQAVLDAAMQEKIAQRDESDRLFREEMTQRRLMDEALQAQNEELEDTRLIAERERRRYLDLFEFAPDAYLITDSRGNIREANRAAVLLLNAPQADLTLGWPLRRFVVPEERRRLDSRLEQMAPHPGARESLDLTLQPRRSEPLLASAVVAPIVGPDGRVAGLRWMLRDVTEARQAEARLKASLDEKVVLLKEIHHRVKNNLQIISALLGLQRGRVTDPGAETILRDSQNRIRSIALVHEKLYRSHDLARVDLAEYLGALAGSLVQSYAAAPRVTLEIEAEPVHLDIDTILPCGLIVNELVSNALKHAFPGRRDGAITVSLAAAEGAVRLRVRDDGVGFPPEVDYRRSDSLGLQLIRSLAGQLGATLELTAPPEGGADFLLVIPKNA
ncbi:MAG: PAS domain-containing protein [Candidatus Zixiibacteriota bacterium]|nr:MAG: PAS domain-containing protein [candidate division Zixibacteria bacterium]